MKLIIIIFLLFISLIAPKSILAKNDNPYWKVQSVDTMKLSRDKAREKLTDPSFDSVIRTEISNISDVGATHVAIGTPYDEEFLPYLRRWVKIAREHGLNIWFRGNFSGWEGWFEYPDLSPEEHRTKVKDFILKNSDLFKDGDIFTPCPECENGGPGDPRHTGDIPGFRNFLIDEHEISSQAFSEINKDVASNYFSMNADVSGIVMDNETSQSLDGIIVIDHYVNTPFQLYSDITKIAQNTDSKIVLGEVGVPIPDIHGQMTQTEQADWLKEAFVYLSRMQNLYGINYWVGSNGSTAIFDFSK